jgi:hypothetical protein
MESKVAIFDGNKSMVLQEESCRRLLFVGWTCAVSPSGRRFLKKRANLVFFFSFSVLHNLPNVWVYS